MDTLDGLLQQIKAKEELDNAYTKKIKECEATIKAEEVSIKYLQALRIKLSNDLKNKFQENCEKEIACEFLKLESEIWGNLLEKTQNELKEEDVKLDELQQRVCLNRIQFCDSTREFFNNYNLFKMSSNLKNNSLSIIYPAKTIKTETDDGECNSLLENIKLLENQLEELKSEEVQTEEATQLKVQLQAEPSSGENFIRLQNSLKNMRDEHEKLKLKIKRVKSGIAQKELFLNRGRRQTSDLLHRAQDIHKHPQELILPVAKRQNVEQTVPVSKIVKFDDSVQIKQIQSSALTANILETRAALRANSPSPGLRRKLSQQLQSKLDEGIKNILFKN